MRCSPHLTVTQNIGFGLRNGTRDGAWIERALDDMHLGHLGARYPHTLSGGQQQRIALLRALAPTPAILLLDEPFSGLDEHLRQRVRQETREILAESGVTTLMVTHNPEAAMFLADRIVVLNDGRVAQDAPPVDIYTAPADPFIVRMFGPANEFGGVVRDGMLDTVLGPIAAKGVENGKKALCLVRADGVDIVTSPPNGRHHYVRMRVETARVLGPSSYLLLKPSRGESPERASALVEARLSGIHLPATGSEVWARPSEEQTFVFTPRLTRTAERILPMHGRRGHDGPGISAPGIVAGSALARILVTIAGASVAVRASRIRARSPARAWRARSARPVDEGAGAARPTRVAPT